MHLPIYRKGLNSSTRDVSLSFINNNLFFDLPTTWSFVAKTPIYSGFPPLPFWCSLSEFSEMLCPRIQFSECPLNKTQFSNFRLCSPPTPPINNGKGTCCLWRSLWSFCREEADSDSMLETVSLTCFYYYNHTQWLAWRTPPLCLTLN